MISIFLNFTGPWQQDKLSTAIEIVPRSERGEDPGSEEPQPRDDDFAVSGYKVTQPLRTVFEEHRLEHERMRQRRSEHFRWVQEGGEDPG